MRRYSRPPLRRLGMLVIRSDPGEEGSPSPSCAIPQGFYTVNFSLCSKFMSSLEISRFALNFKFNSKFNSSLILRSIHNTQIKTSHFVQSFNSNFHLLPPLFQSPSIYLGPRPFFIKVLGDMPIQSLQIF